MNFELKQLTMAFGFLDEVREDGSINMFGAAPVLAQMYGIPKHDAREILTLWMDSFSEEEADVRAEKALTNYKQTANV